MDAGSSIYSKVGFLLASGELKKATDNDLHNASKFIAESNVSKLATKYLGLTSQQIEGRDVFDVLKLWRDAMPYQGFKDVSVEIFKLLFADQHSYLPILSG